MMFGGQHTQQRFGSIRYFFCVCGKRSFEWTGTIRLNAS